MPLAAVAADALHHLEKRLLQHVLGVLGVAEDAARQVVDRGLESAVQRLQRRLVSGLGPGHQDVGNGEGERHRLNSKMR